MQQLILCTCPDQNSAEMLARLLIEANLAACVNVMPGLTSIYAWQGEIETAQEHLLLIKTHKDRYAAVETALKNAHPYQLPEIIAVTIDQGFPEYLQWIDTCLGIN